MSNELRNADNEPATLTIVGQTVMEKLPVNPLGNFQSQEEQQLWYQDSDTRNYNSCDPQNCLNAKLVIVIQHPTAPGWKVDYDAATSRLDDLQEKIAKGSAPRQYLLDKDHNPPFIQLSFPLWEKKVRFA